MRRYTMVLCLLCGTCTVSAQDYDHIERRNFWNAGHNAAGIRMDSATISYAEVYGTNRHGDLRDYSDARKIWSAGAVAKTMAHEEKYSMTGSFRFDHTTGSDMGGSMFVKPGYYPIDVLEFTPGRKTMQTYAFAGGVSGDVGRGWRLGAAVGFTGYNYSKRKDLRHTNYRLELEISPSAMYQWGDNAVGVSYTFGRNREKMDVEKLGTVYDDSHYAVFLDKGLMYGLLDEWKSGGLHLSQAGVDGFPVLENSHGVALQLQLRTLYIDAGYTYSRGEMGENKYISYKFPTHAISSNAGYRFSTPGITHYVRLGVDWSHQVNYENSIYTVEENSVTKVYNSGANRIFERNAFGVRAEYEIIAPCWELTAGGGYRSLDRLTSQMYPYLFSQSADRWNIHTSGLLRIGGFDLKADVGFSSGDISDKFRMSDSDTGAGDPPDFLQEYYDLQSEYLTASRLDAEIAVRYTFFVGIYAEVAVGYSRGFDLKYIGGQSRWYETINIGYIF